MIRHYIIAALVVAAIVTVETHYIVALGCVAAALVLSNVKASYTY